MDLIELRDPAAARDYLLQGLWLQRVARPAAGLVRPALEWALEIVAGGQPMPPVGVVADIGHLVYGLDPGRQTRDPVDVPHWSAHGRQYEDTFLGKLYADWTFERATDALRRYTGRDQAKGLAYVVKQIRDRWRLGGTEVPPAVVRGLLGQPSEQLLADGFEAIGRDGVHPLLVKQYDALVAAARRAADVLGAEDVIALEQRTALADMGQYVAHRQILQTAARLEARLPPRPVRPLVGRKEVPTRVLDEDTYPVGGYTSIANKGSVESLLHSQLAFMEDQSPDLFDMKFVRDELFYYSRDENQFLRRRRVFVFALYPSLVQARFKDAELPTQRVVLALAAILTLVRKLTDWLTTDALRFEILFVQPAGADQPLAHEAELLTLLLKEPIERGSAVVRATEASAVEPFLAAEARTSQVQCLTLSGEPVPLAPDAAVVSRLTVNGPRPPLADGHGETAPLDADDAFDYWSAVVVRVLELWV